MAACVVMYALVGFVGVQKSMLPPDSTTTVEQKTPQAPGLEAAGPLTYAPLPVEELPQEKYRTLLAGFVLLSGVMAIASVVVRKKMCSPEAIRYGVQSRYAKEASDTSVEGLKDARAMGGTPADVAAAKVAFPGYVASWLLAEAVSLNGYSLSQLLHKPGIYLWFGIPSFLLLIWNRPRSLSSQ